jgi:hypothetical protein
MFESRNFKKMSQFQSTSYFWKLNLEISLTFFPILWESFGFPKKKEEIFNFHRKSNFFRNPISTASARPAGLEPHTTSF